MSGTRRKESAMATPVIELEQITMLRGNDQAILRDINWTIRRGEHWALLGANGSGKTSLLKIVCGYEWPTEGRVRVLGKPFGEYPIGEVRKHIGWVSSSLQTWVHEEDTALDVAVSGYEASFGLWREFSGRELEAARRALGSVGAEELEGRAWGVLSQGERQRVLIARALVGRPALLILDEPCAGLDPVARSTFLGDLAKLIRRAGAPTLVLVTHHVEEIPEGVNRALVLKDGRTLAKGAVAKVCTSEVLSEAFGRRCEVSRSGSGLELRVLSESAAGRRRKSGR
jgi:iron complex transport system ATP-binding protein